MLSPKWINNVRLPWREGLWQIEIADGKIARISAQPQQPSPVGQSLDGEGGLACAPFIEPHIHLDTTQTAGEPAWNQSGTLFEGIERWAEQQGAAQPRRCETAGVADAEVADRQRHSVCAHSC